MCIWHTYIKVCARDPLEMCVPTNCDVCYICTAHQIHCVRSHSDFRYEMESEKECARGQLGFTRWLYSWDVEKQRSKMQAHNITHTHNSTSSCSFSIFLCLAGSDPCILNTIEVMATNHIKYKFLFMLIEKQSSITHCTVHTAHTHGVVSSPPNKIRPKRNGLTV